ncbi:MAG: DUF58 domain-containing protein [Bacteroidota bacterium]|nr:DUF58 domain-containing protein [Bacteroidota bacterium]
MSKYTLKETDFLQITNIELLAKQVVEGFLTGLHKSPYHGFSVEFAEHRQYNNGESTKNIDWKLYARTDKLFVKRFEEETNLRCQLVIDTSGSMYYPTDSMSKIRFSIIAAASLIQLMKKQRDAAGVSLFSDELWFHSQAKLGLTHQKLLFSKLQSCLSEPTESKGSNIAKTLHYLAEGMHKRSMVIIFSDFFQGQQEELFDALQHLKYNKHEVILFDIQDQKQELDFTFDNRPYIFKDSETGEELKLHPNAVKEMYNQNYSSFKEAIKLKCLQYKIDYNEAIIGNDFNQVLQSFIRKRR